MSTQLSQEKLEEMVVGVAPNPNAIFYEQAVLNVARSKEANRRMYDTQVYIKLSQPGVADHMSYQATQQDIRNYPEEYEYFLQNKQGDRAPGVEMIPNLDIAHLQELRDYGFLTIPKFAAMEIVPPHLEYAHRAAKLLNAALQESSNGSKQEEVIEEDSRTESEKAGFMPETDRPVNGIDVGRSDLSAREEDTTNGRSSEGHEEGGRKQRDNPVKYDPTKWTFA